MVTFRKIDGIHGYVRLIGSHDLKIPALGVIYICNFNRFVCANGDALFLKKMANIRGWNVLTWAHLWLFNKDWMNDVSMLKMFDDLISKISEDVGSEKVFLRFHPNGEVYLHVDDYDDNFVKLTRIFQLGHYNL